MSFFGIFIMVTVYVVYRKAMQLRICSDCCYSCCPADDPSAPSAPDQFQLDYYDTRVELSDDESESVSSKRRSSISKMKLTDKEVIGIFKMTKRLRDLGYGSSDGLQAKATVDPEPFLN